jgi:hypothetical protein
LSDRADTRYRRSVAAERASGPTTALCAALAIAALLVATLPLSAAMKRRFLANHQLRPSSTAAWIAIGLLPKMYGGRHEMWMSAEPLTDYLRADPTRAPFPVAHYWVNHQPGRAVRLDGERRNAVAAGATTYVRLTSSYGDVSLTSSYRVRAADGRIDVQAAP